jgi:hypothetical protein
MVRSEIFGCSSPDSNERFASNDEKWKDNEAPHPKDCETKEGKSYR